MEDLFLGSCGSLLGDLRSLLLGGFLQAKFFRSLFLSGFLQAEFFRCLRLKTCFNVASLITLREGAYLRVMEERAFWPLGTVALQPFPAVAFPSWKRLWEGGILFMGGGTGSGASLLRHWSRWRA